MRDIGKDFELIKTIFILPLIVLVVTSCPGNPVGSESSFTVSIAQLIDPAAIFVGEVTINNDVIYVLFQELQNGTSEELLFTDKNGQMFRLGSKFGFLSFLPIDRDYFIFRFDLLMDLNGVRLSRDVNTLIVRMEDKAAFYVDVFEDECMPYQISAGISKNHLVLACSQSVFYIDTKKFDVARPLNNPSLDPIELHSWRWPSPGIRLPVTEDGDLLANNIYFSDQRAPVTNTFYKANPNHRTWIYDSLGTLYSLEKPKVVTENGTELYQFWTQSIRIGKNDAIDTNLLLLFDIDSTKSGIFSHFVSSHNCALCFPFEPYEIYIRFEKGFAQLRQTTSGFNVEFFETTNIPAEANTFEAGYAYWSDKTTIFRARIAENADKEIVVSDENMHEGSSFYVSGNLVTYSIIDGFSIHTYQIVPGGEPELVSTSGSVPREILRF